MSIVKSNWTSAHELARLIKQCLSEGNRVDIEGLGTFVPDGKEGFEFLPINRPQVFLAYVVEDSALVDQLCFDLQMRGFDPWIDRQRLLPGQNWPRAIQHAIEASDYFIGCFSRNSVAKRGNFQAELRYALDCAQLVPQDEIFFIPVRLDDCQLPLAVSRSIQYVDLFPDWDKGVSRIVSMVRRQQRRRPKTPAAA